MARRDEERPGSAWLDATWHCKARFFMYNIDEMSLDETSKRALAAFYASDADDLVTSAKIQELNGLSYAVLRRGSKVLACYRVRNDGKLKRMIRLPVGL